MYHTNITNTYFRIVLLLAFCAVVGAGCHTSSAHRVTASPHKEVKADSMNIATMKAKAEAKMLDTAEIRLPAMPRGVYRVASIERTSCATSCPTYTAEIYSDGHCTYKGKAWVRWMGNYQGVMDTALLRRVKAKAKSIHYSSLASIYTVKGQTLNDFPFTITSFDDGQRQYTIKNHFNAPTALLEWEVLVEEVLNEVAWKRDETR